MTKTEFAAAVAGKTDLTNKQAEKVVNAALEVITEALAKGEKVQFTGFGTFEVRERPERVGRNPQTKATITIPASKAPAFKAGSKLKDSVK